MVCFLDTETTGLYPGNICQLAYVLQEGKSVTAKNFFFEVNSVEYGAFLVHGFSVEKLKELSGGLRFNSKIDEIEKDFCLSDVLVSHNTAFDFMFLREEFTKNGRVFKFNEEFCTMKETTSVCKLKRSSGLGYKYPKLSELTAFLGVTDGEIEKVTNLLYGSDVDYHDARFDCTAVYLAVNKGLGVFPCFDKLKKFIGLEKNL